MSKGQMIANMLEEGSTIERYKEGGNSMLPLIKSNQPVTLTPCKDIELKVNDIVFCKVKGRFVTHKILKMREDQYQIGNNRGFVNGWVRKEKIYGLVTKVWDK